MRKAMIRLAMAGMALACGSAAAQPDAADPRGVVRYDGYHLVRINCTDHEMVHRLEQLGAEHVGCEVRRGPNDFMIAPGAMGGLRASGIGFEVLSTNLQERIDAETARIRNAAPDGPWFDDYKNLAAIEAYMDELVALRPSIVSKFSMGTTVQGRQIQALRISNDAINPGACKPAALFHGAQHAREWITPMTAVYVADQLVREYGSDPYITDLVDRVEFFIVPVANPDGYLYTWTNNRMWRKNRRQNSAFSYGVDLNRNWGYQWGGQGASTSPSNDTYRGPSAFSEPETQRLRDFVLANPNIKAHNDIHSYGNLLLWPWGYTADLCPDHATFDEIGTRMQSEILAVHGNSFNPGPVYTTIYPASGVSVDWMYGHAGIYSVSYELRGGRFDPPASEIILSCEETLPATLYQAEWIADRFPYRADWNGDCAYDVFDFLAFQNDFAASAPRADYNRDSSFDIFDFLEFQNDFVAQR